MLLKLEDTLEDIFAQRVKKFFQLRRIDIDKIDTNKFINYLFQEFEKQGRFKRKEDGTIFFNLTSRFVISSLNKYLNNNPLEKIELFREHMLKRSCATYSQKNFENLRVSEHRSGGLIHLLGRKHKPEYKITKADGSVMTPSRITKTKKLTSSFNVSFSPLAPQNAQNGARKRALASDDSCYEQDMVSSDMALWRKKTPNKNSFFSPNRVCVRTLSNEERSAICKTLSFSYDLEAKKETKEQFAFNLTREDILARIGEKRPVSQKSVMGNVSAFEVMKAIGVVVTEKQNGRSFHWAHRRGWALHGEQEKDNFDPMTAGSNFDTLFKLEAPLKKLLLEQELNEVSVKGEVEFDKENGLPFKVTYRLSWGTLDFIEVVIDPMSHRVPTVDEHEVANTFFDMTVVPRM